MACRSVKWMEGSIFRVPQSDGVSSVGQVLRHVPEALNSVICSFHDRRIPSTISVAADQLAAKELISIQFTTPDLLKSGIWELAGHGTPQGLDRMPGLRTLEDANFVGAKVVGSGIMMEFLDAFYGLRPWDDYADPKYFDKLLSPGLKRPAHVVLTKT